MFTYLETMETYFIGYLNYSANIYENENSGQIYIEIFEGPPEEYPEKMIFSRCFEDYDTATAYLFKRGFRW